MKRLLAAATIALAGCSSQLIVPEDPRYEELCVIYVGEAQGAEITREVFDQCQTIEIMVVRFPI